MKKMISASIVLYHTKMQQVQEVILSYAPAENRKLYIIDNSETQHPEYKYFKKMAYVEYMFIGENLGYGKGHNIGIKKAIEEKTEYHIVLNPDLCFNPAIIDALINYADKNPDVVYILPKVMYPNGETQYLCKLLPTPFDLMLRRFLPNIGIFKKLNDRYVLRNSGYNRIINPPCLSGCFMFMRTKTLEKYELFFDENFFMYCEDFDLIRRLHRIGKTIYYPYVQIIHDHGRESYKDFNMLKMHIKSACKYFNKYGWIADKERKKENKKILNEICVEMKLDRS
ncbi:MAG: glycosyltransferase family 2 protein [Clostridiales bacterium]|nr:glycosyltransferase family 2 protein [Clostridiales bacterium]